MSSKDDRIVQMEFDNADFERRLSDTLKSLDALSKGLELAGAKQGLTDVNAAANSFDTSKMSSALENISHKFSALGAVGFTVIQDLTNGLLGMVTHLLQVGKQDILEPIITGGKSRAENIQQAKFQFEGLGIDVNKGMQSALDAVKGTAYGLDEAAKVASQFGASGIKAGDQMTSALRGISGAAAMTGSSFSDIGNIYTGIAGMGKVTNQDFMQFATRGLNAAAAVGKQLNLTEAQVHQMATDGKLDFATFADAMNKAFGEHATQANQTYAGALSNVHAAMSRMGASFFSDRLTQQRDLFNALTPVIDNVTKALEPLTKAILEVSGEGTKGAIAFLNGIKFTSFTSAMELVGQIVRDTVALIKALLGSVEMAFRQVFPPSTTSTLLTVTGAILDFVQALYPSKTTLIEISKIFSGIFSIFDIGWAILKGVLNVFASLFESFDGAGGGLLKFGGGVGDTLTRLDLLLVKTGAIHNFFDSLAEKVKVPIAFLKELADAIDKLFGRISDTKAPEEGLNRVEQRFGGLSAIFDHLGLAGSNISNALMKTFDIIGNWLKDLGKNIANALKPGDFDAAVDSVNVGLLGGIVLMLKRFLSSGGLNLNVGAGVFAKVNANLMNLNNTLKAMTMELKSKALMEIAIAIGILAASILTLSLIDSAKLTMAMTGLAAGFAQLVAVMKLLDSIASGPTGALKLGLLGAAMIEMATSVAVLAGAVRLLSGLSWEELAKGLAGVGVALGLMVGAALIVQGDSAGMIAASIAMNAMATAMVILAGAVKAFSTMSWGEMAKGLAGVALSLGIIMGIMQAMPVASLLAAGIAMIPLATGIVILSGAVKLLGDTPIGELAKGLGAMFIALAMIAVAMEAMPLTLPITAAGLILVGIALGIMGEAIKMIGSLDLATIGKGLGAITLLLLVLGAAMETMQTALPGAAAMIVAAGAMAILSEVLIKLSALSWMDIVKGLVAMAATFVVLGLAGLVLEPVIPALLGLGVAMALVGVGFVLFGAGAYMVGKAITELAEAGQAGIHALIDAISEILAAIPHFIMVFVGSLVESTGNILNATKLMLVIFTALLIQILETVVKLAPNIAEALVAIITAGLFLIRAKFPDVVDTAFELLMVLLGAIKEHAGEVTQSAIDIVINFGHTLSDNANRLVNSAIDLIQAFLGAIDHRMNDIAAMGLNVLLSLLAAMINNMYRVSDFAVSVVITLAQTIENEIERIVRAGADILIRLAQSLADNTWRVASKAVDIVLAFLNAIGDQAIRLANGGADALIHFLNGLADAINTKAPEIRKAGGRVADAIIDGITGGIDLSGGKVWDSIKNIAGGAVDSFLKAIHAKSPSRTFMEAAAFIPQGIAMGIDNDNSPVESVVAKAEQIIQAFSESISKMPDSLEGLDASPVITPVLDLSKVQDAAQGLNALLPNPTITPDVSYAQARTISTTAEVVNPTPPPSSNGPTEIKFEQHNYSPEALSTNDIYQGTKSQLALAKEELKL